MSECVWGGYADRERVREWFEPPAAATRPGLVFAAVTTAQLGAVCAAAGLAIAGLAR